MFTLLYVKFTQDNTYQILSESAGFVEDMTKHFGVFFGLQCIGLYVYFLFYSIH